MTYRASVDDPRYDQTPAVPGHQPVLLRLLSPDCQLGTCEHQGPPHCPTTPTKVCAGCTRDEVREHPTLEELTAGAMQWPCPAAMTGGNR